MKTGLRKLFALILTAALLMTSAAISANAAEPAFAVSSVQGAEGDEIAVNISLLNNPGITALSVQVSYSADDLELLGINGAGLFEDNISTSQLTQNPLTVSWYASDSSNKSDSGVFAVLRFKIKDGAQSSRITLSYDEDNIFNNTFDNVFFSTVNGQITVRPKGLTGDADGDGDITVADATLVQRYAAMLRTDIFTVVLMGADVDGDGVLTIIDATFIRRYLAGMEIPYKVG